MSQTQAEAEAKYIYDYIERIFPEAHDSATYPNIHKLLRDNALEILYKPIDLSENIHDI